LVGDRFADLDSENIVIEEGLRTALRDADEKLCQRVTEAA
jgi:hypothetical protein